MANKVGELNTAVTSIVFLYTVNLDFLIEVTLCFILACY